MKERLACVVNLATCVGLSCAVYQFCTQQKYQLNTETKFTAFFELHHLAVPSHTYATPRVETVQ